MDQCDDSGDIYSIPDAFHGGECVTNQYEILHSPFDIETHKKTFINYLEVVIDPDGVVHYAIPSHHEFLIKRVMKMLNIKREEIPIEDYPDSLYKITKCISVWNSWFIGSPNVKQINTLKLLKQEGLYEGDIHE